MKFASKLVATLATVALTVFVFLAPPSAPKVQAASDVAANWGYFPLWTNAVAVGAGATNAANPNIDIDQGKVLHCFASLVTTNASTSNVVFRFRTSLDGQVWATQFAYTNNVALTGTTSNNVSFIVATNIPARFISWAAVDGPTTLQTVTLYSLGYAWLPAIGR